LTPPPPDGPLLIRPGLISADDPARGGARGIYRPDRWAMPGQTAWQEGGRPW